MKCPICGADNKESQMYCVSCGASLSGPQSITLGEQTNEKSNNDITMITGIDLTSLAKENPVVNKQINNPKPQLPPKNEKTSREKKQLPNIIPLLSAIITILLGVLCIFFYVNNQKLQKQLKSYKCDCPETKCEVDHSTIQGIYGKTSKFSFYLPDGWQYTETSGETVISSNKAAIIVKGYEEGRNDKVTNSNVGPVYQEVGISNIEIKEDVLDKRKIVYVLFNKDNVYFGDFYYQYDSEKYVYGQISSANANDVLHADVKSILSTVTIDLRKNNSVNKASVPYNKIIPLLK